MTFTLAEVRAERLKRNRDEQAIRHLAPFVRAAWQVLEPGKPLIWGPHMQIVCDEVEALIREHWRRVDIMREAVEDAAGDPDEVGRLIEDRLGDLEALRLVVNIPPGCSKSTIISVCLPAWIWLHDPGHRYLGTSRAISVARRDSRKTRKLLRSRWYQAIAATCAMRREERPWKLADDQQTKENFETTLGGFRLSLPIHGGITGERVDGMGIDDPYDAKEALTGTLEQVTKRMAEVVDIFDNAVEDRLAHAAVGYIIVIMQVLHELDLSEELKRRGWPAIVLPMEYDPGHPYRFPGDWRTEAGELLIPGVWPASAVERERGKFGFAAKFQQRPVPAEGGRVKRGWFESPNVEPYHESPEEMARQCDEVWLSVDAAKKGSAKADYHAVQCWGRKGQERYPLAAIAERWDYPEFERVLLREIQRWRAVRPDLGILIEDTANGTTFMQLQRHAVPGMVPFRPRADTPGPDHSKGARFTYVVRAAESGLIVPPRSATWWPPLLLNWLAFPDGAHDDPCDATSQINMRWSLRVIDLDEWDDYDPAVSI